jgi:hypothetical protein
MKEKVLIQEVSVTKKGEVKIFRIKLPSDAKTIIGIEKTILDLPPLELSGSRGSGDGIGPSAGYVIPWLQFQPNFLIGDLRLQSLKNANIFYAGEVRDNDYNVGYWNFSLTISFGAAPWTHGYRREEEVVKVNECCGEIRGIFRDRLGAKYNTDIPYTVKIYLWYTSEEECKTEKQ